MVIWWAVYSRPVGYRSYSKFDADNGPSAFTIPTLTTILIASCTSCTFTVHECIVPLRVRSANVLVVQIRSNFRKE
jgi:hypothetical protein